MTTTIRVWTNYAQTGDQPEPEVQWMDLEEYLRGVVSHEMSPSFPLEALRAQAVAARTYAIATLKPNGRPRHGDMADVCTTDHCQRPQTCKPDAGRLLSKCVQCGGSALRIDANTASLQHGQLACDGVILDCRDERFERRGVRSPADQAGSDAAFVVIVPR